MATITITEALAEIKTIGKRIEKKRNFILQHLYLQGNIKDPFQKDGGSEKVVAQERQSLRDLEERILKLRMAISKANSENTISIDGQERSIADWIVWRREVATGAGDFLQKMSAMINSVRQQAMQKSVAVVEGEAGDGSQIAIHVNERSLSAEIDTHEKILGELDGQLSLKNATVMIDV